MKLFTTHKSLFTKIYFLNIADKIATAISASSEAEAFFALPPAGCGITYGKIVFNFLTTADIINIERIVVHKNARTVPIPMHITAIPCANNSFIKYLLLKVRVLYFLHQLILRLHHLLNQLLFHKLLYQKP